MQNKKQASYFLRFIVSGVLVCLFFVVFSSYAFASEVSPLKLYHVETSQILNNDLEIQGGINPGLVIPVGAPAIQNQILELKYTRTHKSNDVMVFFGRQDLKLKQFPKKLFHLPSTKKQTDFSLDLKTLPYYNGTIDFIAIAFVGENETINLQPITLRPTNLKEKFKFAMDDIFTYAPFSAHTINFLKYPTLNGKFLNRYLFWILFCLFLLSTLLYILLKNNSQRSRIISINILIIALFWVLLDVIHLNNQIKIYREFAQADNILQNGRLGYSDFYPFLGFISQNTEKGKTGIFLAPYPFDFEGKYHIYPLIKFDTIDNVDYIFTYSSKETHYDAKNKLLTYRKKQFKIKQVLSFTPNAHIFVIDKSD